MSFLADMLQLHPLFWAVPLLSGPMVAAVGDKLSRRWLAALSLGGIAWTLLHSLLAVIYLLWGPVAGQDTRMTFDFMTGDPLFSLTFALDLRGAWATLLTAVVGLAAQIHALSSIVHFTGRHRFHALVLTLTGAAAFLFTAHSPMSVLIGWEGLTVAGAFLYAFWESEAHEARTGMRWLLFQRASGVLLLLAFLLEDLGPTLQASLLVAAACIRAGQLPFHGWVPHSMKGTASATTLVFGVGSTLASVFLLDRAWGLIVQTQILTDIIALVGAAGVVMGILAALQQQEPVKVLGWLFMVATALCFLGFGVGDPVAARLLVTGVVLVLGGSVLAYGGLSGEVAKFVDVGGTSLGLRSRWSYLVLAAAVAAPPSLVFVGLARMLGSAPHQALGLALQIIVCLAALAMGWILQWLRRTAPGKNQGDPPSSAWQVSVPVVLWAIAFALGLAALFLFGWAGVGDVRGLTWALINASALAAGWILRWLLTGRPAARFAGRLTTTQRMMDRVAGTGLGVGEMVVQLPLMLARALGVLVWRVLGDFVVDTLILGSAVRTVEGVGTALRYVQNGRIQRYSLVVVLATLILLFVMLR